MTYDEIGSGGMIADGSGDSTVILTETGSGGVIAAGQSNNTFSETADGGVSAVGSGNSTAILTETADGGTITGGSVSVAKISGNIEASGGMIAGGSVSVFVTRTEIGSGGGVTGGHTIIIDQPYIGGGMVAGGTSSVLRMSYLTGTGGAVCGGSGRQTFFDYETASGGVRTTAGHGKVEKIKYRVPSEPRTGIGRAIEGCVLAEVPTPESELFKPKYFEEQPTLKTNPRQQLTGVWCQVEDACEEGVLPRVIQKRQKGIIPDPKGTISPRDRGIATATGI